MIVSKIDFEDKKRKKGDGDEEDQFGYEILDEDAGADDDPGEALLASARYYILFFCFVGKCSC